MLWIRGRAFFTLYNMLTVSAHVSIQHTTQINLCICENLKKWLSFRNCISWTKFLFKLRVMICTFKSSAFCQAVNRGVIKHKLWRFDFKLKVILQTIYMRTFRLINLGIYNKHLFALVNCWGIFLIFCTF